MTPPPIFPDKTICLSPRLFAGIGYYALAAAYGTAVILDNSLYDKRDKEAHRYTIADTHGPVTLTMPVAKPHGIPRATWSQVGISSHGEWWHTHRVTLESAYGRTPFFEFYIDGLLPYLSSSTPTDFPSVGALDTAITAHLLSLMSIPTRVIAASTLPQDTLRELLSPTTQPDDDVTILRTNLYETTLRTRLADPAIYPPYYQVRAHQQGFIPSLSILDLLFNLGPEAPLYLARLF